MRAGAALVVAAFAAPVGAWADQAPDLARYDCTRLDDGATQRGDDLAKAGFEIASVGRFGQPNVVMIDPKSSARANCIVRGGAAR